MTAATRLIRVNVLAVAGDAVTVGVPDPRGGHAELTLSPPYVSPQFTPDVGGEALLLMSGPVPYLLPQKLKENAVTFRELAKNAVTKDQIAPGALDGTTMTGTEVQSRTDGERIVFTRDSVGAVDNIRFYPVTGDRYAWIYGQAEDDINGNSVGGFFLQSGAAGVSGLPTACLIKVGPDGAYLDAYVTGPLVARVGVTGAAGFRVQVGAALTTKLQITTAGVAFNNVTPIARRTVNAAATDLPTVIALTNQLRTLLIDLGLAQ